MSRAQESAADRRADIAWPAAAAGGAGWTATQWAALRYCYLAYFAIIFSRTAVGIALPAMQADPQVALSHEKLSKLLSTSSAVYFMGKLVSGMLVDTLGGRRVLVLVLSFIAGSYAVFSTAAKSMAPLYAGMWVSYFWTTAGWPAMGKCAGGWFREERSFGSAWSILSTSSRIAAVSASLSLGWLLRRRRWQALMRTAMGGSAAVAALLVLRLHEPPPVRAAQPGEGAAAAPAAAVVSQTVTSPEKPPPPAQPLWRGVARVLRVRRIWLLFASQACLTPIIDSIGNLVPLFFNQGVGATDSIYAAASVAGLSPARAGQAAALYPLGAVLSITSCGQLYSKLQPAQRMTLVGGLTALATCGFGVLARASHPPKVAGAALFCAMFGIAVPAYSVNVPYLNKVAGPYAGTLMGAVDAPGNLTAILFMLTYPRLLARGGWGGLFAVCGKLTACSFVLMGTFQFLEWRDPLDPLV